MGPDINSTTATQVLDPHGLPVPTRRRTLIARQLRHDMNGLEWKLWSHLRLHQLDGHKFRRQVPIGPFFVDFACLKARVVVEIDGPAHDFTVQADARRDAWLEAAGYLVLRYTADWLAEDTDAVVEDIGNHLAGRRSPRGPSLPSPPSGEAS